jgi:formylglycine-generating enzyme
MGLFRWALELVNIRLPRILWLQECPSLPGGGWKCGRLILVLLLVALTCVDSQPYQDCQASVPQVNSGKAFTEVDGMIYVPPGTFWMGWEEKAFIDTTPIHQVHIDGFLLDKVEVTNRQYAQFVKATGYITVAERKPDAKDFPDAPPENLVPGSLVFTPPPRSVPLNSHYRWWQYVPGASWRHPEGPASNLTGRANYPVVQVAWDDAVAYAKWAHKRLPTEAEFEYAARGGLDRKWFSWGDELKPGGKWRANIWQGKFPNQNTAEDGFKSTAPVGSFPANGYGLYDMTGNVWQWCSDWYRSDYYATLPAGKTVINPRGPIDSFDPTEPGTLKRVQRGGSFLCTDQYCARYLVGARGKGEISSGCSNVGFRCARDKDSTRHQ